jgi:hypothetical protein
MILGAIVVIHKHKIAMLEAKERELAALCDHEI